jgi:ATP-dependent Lhr-like helicase
VFESVLDMLAGKYPSDAFAELRPRLVWDRTTDVLTGRPGAQRLAVTSGGTIPDRGLFAVHIAGGGGRVGELDEEMVYESRVGDTIALGATSWQIVEITHDRVHVVPTPGAPGRLPFWRGDALGRPVEIGRAIGAFSRELTKRSPEAAVEWLAERSLDAWASQALVAYVEEQQASASQVPTDRTLVVERTRDELGDWRIAVLSPFGARVHAPWALLARARLEERFGVDASVAHSDDGLVARLPDLPSDDWVADATDCLFPDPESIQESVTRLIGGSALFASRFRECAARALLLPRLQPGRRAPLWQQRQRSAQLLQVAAEHPTFPIVLEAVRECLQDVYDLPAFVQLMSQVRQRSVRVVEAAPSQASPFARSLLFGYVAEFLYEGDTPLAEKRAAALTLDPTLLGELLGQADLRDLLEPEAISAVVAQLQHLTEERRCRGPEDAADLLRLLGPLDEDAGRERGVDPAWWQELHSQRRVIPTRVAGRDVWAAVEDAGRLRDGVGAPLPQGIPAAHLEPVADPVGDLLTRYSRTHGPFTSAQAATALGLPPAVVEDRLSAERRAGRLLVGRFLPDAAGVQWCHPDVLRLIKRRSIALLRHQIEPVGQSTLAAFLPRWQQIPADPGDRLRGAEGVLEVARMLAGAPLPLASLETALLPLRVAGYRPEMLDDLTMQGEVVWTGHGSLPGDDGWIVLAPAGLEALLPSRDVPELSARAESILSVLRQGGGWTARELERRVEQSGDGSTSPGQGLPRAADVSTGEALAELLWAGLVSNDTLAPVRRRPTGGRPRRRPAGARTRFAGARSPRGRYADLMIANGDASAASLLSGYSRPEVASAEAPGRWFALPQPDLAPEQLALLRAEAQLDRWGLVTRGAVVSSGLPGGFAAVYRTLRAMEDRGRVQRVYAVEGLGAAQFAAPGVVDQLRAVDSALTERARSGDPPANSTGDTGSGIVLAAADPANAYGAALEWPSSDWSGVGGAPHRPGRTSGSHVVLVAGRVVMYLERGGHTLLTFGVTQSAASAQPASGDPPASTGNQQEGGRLPRAVALLAEAIHDARVGEPTITRINGVEVLEHRPETREIHDALLAAGFTLTPRGLRLRRKG